MSNIINNKNHKITSYIKDMYKSNLDLLQTSAPMVSSTIKLTSPNIISYPDKYFKNKPKSFEWAYQIEIKNNSSKKLKIIKQHFQFISANSHIITKKTNGLMGKKISINPKQKISYNNKVTLETSSGIMLGYFFLETNDNYSIISKLPVTLLYCVSYPYTYH